MDLLGELDCRCSTYNCTDTCDNKKNVAYKLVKIQHCNIKSPTTLNDSSLKLE